jgi:hypothetical protein
MARELQEIKLQLVEFDELDSIRRLDLPCRAGRFAAGVRLEPMCLAICVQRLGPWLERDLYTGGERRCDHTFGKPHALLTWRAPLQQHASGY